MATGGPSLPDGPAATRLLVFLKAPRNGVAKTRLARDVGAEEATRIYRWLVERQLQAVPRGFAVEIVFTPADSEGEMRAWLGHAYSYRAQADGDLGARLQDAFVSAFRREAGTVIAIGGDCPDLDDTTLREAFRKLARTEVVLGPAIDGGYYLIGLRRMMPRLFEDIPWSSGAVLSTTLARSAEVGLRCELLPVKEDVDDLGSWRRFEERQRQRPAPVPSMAIVFPTLDEAENIGETVSTARARFPDASLLVVDGGSADNTLAIAAGAGATVLSSARGRGVQCRLGAEAAREEWLLFLHADTLLPANAAEVVGRFVTNPSARVATFRLRFDADSWFLRFCAWFTRFDTVFTRFGDQGILIRRSFYQTLGGFPAWPLFEDVALLQRARRESRIPSLPAFVTTSARRFRRRGVYRQQWLNACLLLRYLCGASPERLARMYRSSPSRGPLDTARAIRAPGIPRRE